DGHGITIKQRSKIIAKQAIHHRSRRLRHAIEQRSCLGRRRVVTVDGIYSRVGNVVLQLEEVRLSERHGLKQPVEVVLSIRSSRLYPTLVRKVLNKHIALFLANIYIVKGKPVEHTTLQVVVVRTKGNSENNF